MSDFGKTKSETEHRRVIEMLSVYIDGELPSRDRIKVEEHLAECADCTWELATLRQTVDLMAQLPKVPVPRAFTVHEAQLPKRAGLFQARWVYTYLKGATALAAALLILVLAGDVLFQFQRATTSFAPVMAPAKELAAPAAAPTVVARQEVPPVPMEAPSLPEEALGEAEGATYAEAAPSPPPGEEIKALAPMPTPTAPADRGGGEPTARDDAAATSLATPTPSVGRAWATGTLPPAAAMETPVEEEAPEAPAALAVAPTATPQPRMTATPPPAPPLAPAGIAPSATPQPQMTATPSPAALLAYASATPSTTPTPLATPTATATAAPVPTATPLSVAKAPAEVRPTEEKDAFAEPSARPQLSRLTLLRVVEASLCLLVMVLIAATLIVRRSAKT